MKALKSIIIPVVQSSVSGPFPPGMGISVHNCLWYYAISCRQQNTKKIRKTRVALLGSGFSLSNNVDRTHMDHDSQFLYIVQVFSWVHSLGLVGWFGWDCSLFQHLPGYAWTQKWAYATRRQRMGWQISPSAIMRKANKDGSGLPLWRSESNGQPMILGGSESREMPPRTLSWHPQVRDVEITPSY